MARSRFWSGVSRLLFFLPLTLVPREVSRETSDQDACSGGMLENNSPASIYPSSVFRALRSLCTKRLL